MKVTLLVLLWAAVLVSGCGVSRTLAFSDGSCVIATVYDSHAIFPPRGKVILRDVSSGIEHRFRHHVCGTRLMLDIIEEMSTEHQSASSFLQAYQNASFPKEGER